MAENEEIVAGYEQAIAIIRDTKGWDDPRVKLWVISQLEAEAERHRSAGRS